MQDITITCTDGYKLAATIYKPETLKGAVMIAPATGIKRRFYNSFATYLATNGYGVICYDNRGIGGSATGDINKVDATLINWGKLDMTAVLEALKQHFHNQDYHIIGHSAGGQLVGLMGNALELKSLCNFAASSGSIKNMKYPFKLSAIFFLNVFIPLSNLLFGKTNSQWVGMGEPLPKKVAAQWSQWCSARGYVGSVLGTEIKEHLYDQLTFPSLWLYTTDDGIANKKNVADMTRIFTNASIQTQEFDPATLGKKSIGHMGFFRSKNKDLWQHALDWLDKN